MLHDVVFLEPFLGSHVLLFFGRETGSSIRLFAHDEGVSCFRRFVCSFGFHLATCSRTLSSWITEWLSWSGGSKGTCNSISKDAREVTQRVLASMRSIHSMRLDLPFRRDLFEQHD